MVEQVIIFILNNSKSFSLLHALAANQPLCMMLPPPCWNIGFMIQVYQSLKEQFVYSHCVCAQPKFRVKCGDKHHLDN